MTVAVPPTPAALPTPPSSTNPVPFTAMMDAFLAALPAFQTDTNALGANVFANAQETATNTGIASAAATTSTGAKNVALAASNFKGLWSGLTGALATPASVSYGSKYWMLLANLADVTTATPGVSGSWQLIGDTLGLGTAIASASTINLDTATGDYVHITGNTGITAVTLAAGTERTVTVDGTPAFTHSSTLLLPGAASITADAGTRITFRGEGSGITRAIHWTQGSGKPIAMSGWNLIPSSTVVASGASTIDVEWTNGTYDQIALVFSGITFSTDAVNVALRMKLGGAYDTGSNYLYSMMSIDTGNSGFFGLSTAGTPATSGAIASSAGNAAAKSMDFVVFVRNPASTTFQKRLGVQGDFIKSGGNVTTMYGVIQNSATTALTGVRLFPSAGTASGTVRAYGMSNT